VVIDWGDGKVSGQGTPMMAKNHVDDCSKLIDPISNKLYWAGKKPEACEDTIKVPGDAYFLYNHVYSCSVKSEYFNKNIAYSNKCVFKPKVYIKDNWGWCLGASGSNGYVGDSSCYPNSTFVPFTDNIILEPATE